MTKKIDEIRKMKSIDEKVSAILSDFVAKDQYPVDVESVCEKCGIRVEERDFKSVENALKDDIPDIYIFGVLHRNNKKIQYNVYAKEKAKRFIIAHELAHYFCDEDAKAINISFMAYGVYEPRKYDIFASKLLMPDDKFKEKYNSTLYPTVSQFSDFFGVPKENVMQKFEELELEYIDI